MQDACTDSPDSRDWEYEPVFGSGSQPPKEFFAPVPRIQDQTENADTAMGCTRFALAHVINSQNLRVTNETGTAIPEVIARDYWLEWVKANPSAAKDGATLQSSLEQYRKDGKITAYAKCNGWEETALSSYRLIHTGSLDGDWRETKRTGTYTRRKDGKTAGHAFAIYAYDSEWYYAINSLRDGIFKIRKSEIGTLFTRYAVTDDRDEEAILSYRKRIMDAISIEDAKKALEAGIWNGTNPQAPASREEVSAMVYRALQKLKNG